MSVLSQILRTKIVAIIRGADPDDILKIAEAVYKGGIKVMEITLNSPNALHIIKELNNKMRDRMIIGAGTVLSADGAKNAIGAGAKFIVSPNVNIETIEMTKRNGIVSIPGAYTPTEIVNAHASGGDLIKIFPASNADYMKALHGPLSHIPMMPTGGINIENIGDFQKAGAVAFGVGTALVDAKHKMTVEYLKRVAENAHKFVQAVS